VKSGFATVVAVVAGVASGLGGAYGFSRASARATAGDQPAPRQAVPAVELDPSQPVGPRTPSDQRLSEYESRLRSIEEQQPKVVEVRAPQVSDPLVPAERQRQMVEENHQRSVDQFQAERPDVNWSRDASNRIKASAEAAASRGRYDVLNVECKTTLCALTVEWKNLEDARNGMEAAASFSDDAHCSHEVMLPKVADPARPVRVTVMLDCHEDREQ
jgi:hypothetical protein